jgi:ubiquinone/menaquinone biosynthesis C-methylase UbiE
MVPNAKSPRSLADRGLDLLLSTTIQFSQVTPFRARGGYSNLPIERQAHASSMDKAETEAADWPRFFEFFPSDVRAEIQGRTILDFGSGYGGRTVEYVRQCGAGMAYGCEIAQSQVVAGTMFATECGVSDRVKFDLCGQDDLPYADGMFDAAVTFDVLEHVRDPRVSLQEIWRVLKPGAHLFAAFPLCRGLFSHHLDYLTLFPSLHLLFSAERIIRVVNQELDKRPNIVVQRHRSVWRHYKTGEPVLPMLNGMSLRDFLEAVGPFEIKFVTLNTLVGAAFGHNSRVARFATCVANALPSRLSEPFSFNVAAILRKPLVGSSKT